LPTAVLAGVALAAKDESGKPAVNAAVLLDGGRILLEQHKRLLPFYDVFDEQRYFAPSQPQKVVELDGLRWPLHLRGCMERQELLASPPLRRRSG